MNTVSDNGKSFKFPDGFLWGTAISGHQTEGNNIHSDWWNWEKSKKGIEDSGEACDHYNRFKQDFSLAKNFLHNNAIRISIEWSRIEPEQGKFDEKEIRHYRQVLEELKKLGLKSIVTLHHFTSPLWFSEMGGFEKKENVFYFERFVGKCVLDLGNMIDYWCIFNEPGIYVGMSYLYGLWPPQKRSLLSALRVHFNLVKSHKRAYKIIKKYYPSSSVCTVINNIFFKADSLLLKPLVVIEEFLVNSSFLAFTKSYHDFLGVNYYGFHNPGWKDLIKRGLNKIDVESVGKEKVSVFFRPVYPEGIYRIVLKLHRKYKKPIIITENGIADGNDSKRERFIIDHLVWLNQAIREGVDVRGYFHWSLMDNFEWSLGRMPKYGLFEVNWKTLERIPRNSARLYSKIAFNNAVLENYKIKDTEDTAEE